MPPDSNHFSSHANAYSDSDLQSYSAALLSCPMVLAVFVDHYSRDKLSQILTGIPGGHVLVWMLPIHSPVITFSIIWPYSLCNDGRWNFVEYSLLGNVCKNPCITGKT